MGRYFRAKRWSSLRKGAGLPIGIGLIVEKTGSFFYALGYVGVAALIGALSYIFIVGDVRRVEIDA
ncbi:hypothetical protein [Paraburkholderia aromaticivorans]|uniref:hypothetical protein n=1 Tax=Paraburkholderia aromaticivorans TaxID=2026199 RepID=UPI001455F85C